MGPVVVLVLFVGLQIALRRLVLLPMLQGQVSTTKAAILAGIVWASLPLLGATIGGASWSPEVVAAASLISFASVSIVVRFIVPALLPSTRGPRGNDQPKGGSGLHQEVQS